MAKQLPRPMKYTFYVEERSKTGKRIYRKRKITKEHAHDLRSVGLNVYLPKVKI